MSRLQLELEKRIYDLFKLETRTLIRRSVLSQFL